MRTPDQDYLNRLLRYDDEAGKLFWKERPRSDWKTDRQFNAYNERHAGREAFTSTHDSGFKQGKIDQRRYYAQRIIWKMQHGYDCYIVRHRNGNRLDNRIKNLEGLGRLVNEQSTNAQTECL